MDISRFTPNNILEFLAANPNSTALAVAQHFEQIKKSGRASHANSYLHMLEKDGRVVKTHVKGGAPTWNIKLASIPTPVVVPTIPTLSLDPEGIKSSVRESTETSEHSAYFKSLVLENVRLERNALIEEINKKLQDLSTGELKDVLNSICID